MEVSEWPTSSSAYRLLQLVGEGEFGTVHSALVLEGSHAGESVAVKCLDLEQFPNSNIEAVRTEISIGRLNSHENLVSYYVCFLHDTQLWMVMPLSEGGSLANVLKQLFTAGIKDETILATFLRQALHGLVYLHTNNKIHRDIKASNILFDSDGQVMLTDFGVAADLNLKERNMCRTMVGSPCWMAPEVIENDKGYDYKADIWSFGITAYELAYGQPPYYNYPPMKVIMYVLKAEPPRIKISDPFTHYFRHMVHACLQKDPRRRPSASDLLEFPFFLKARNPEYLRVNIFNKLQPLAELTSRHTAQSGLPDRHLSESWDLSSSSDVSELAESHDLSRCSFTIETDPLEVLDENEDEFQDLPLD
mmetsp:Transcript_34637/g.60909  ORF Transcript_34637/g.60909 Transcript_34637/m.60909 type:complete len:363 (-) Transcript_34637:422-1510(-)